MISAAAEKMQCLLLCGVCLATQLTDIFISVKIQVTAKRQICCALSSKAENKPSQNMNWSVKSKVMFYVSLMCLHCKTSHNYLYSEKEGRTTRRRQTKHFKNARKVSYYLTLERAIERRLGKYQTSAKRPNELRLNLPMHMSSGAVLQFAYVSISQNTVYRRDSILLDCVS